MSFILRRAKIVATLGPATDDPRIIEDTVRAGVDVVRINFSHGALADHSRRLDLVRQAAKRVGRHVGVLGDLQGPKIRVERFKDGKVMLADGGEFALDAALAVDAGDDKAVGIAYKKLPTDVSVGDILLLNDGQISLQVQSIEGPRINTRVLVGGELGNNKGINRQGGGLSAGALTDKDREDICVAASLKVDYLAVSFPRDGSDMNEARKLLRAA
jgi:pyruvate kinase